MRVMQIMAGAEFGGAEAFFVRLALGLHRGGLDQKVVIRADSRRAAALRAGGIDALQLDFGGLLDFGTKLALKREIKAYKPDIVLTWMNRATSFCPRGEFLHVARLGGYYDLKYYRACDHLIGNTQDIVDHIVKGGWPAERAHYLPNFVAGERVQPMLRREFFTPVNAPLLVAMGRMHGNKAFDILLEGVSRVADAYLWLAGDGPLRSTLETYAEKLAVKPRVRFLGWRDDTAALLAASDIFICPSRHEPLGNVVIEAWAQEVPVIAADSLGPGMLIEHMETGVLVPVDDAKALARAIRMLLDDKQMRARIAQAGRLAYERNFTETSVVKQYLAFFERIVAAGPRKDAR